jgi:hypothetical protein
MYYLVSGDINNSKHLDALSHNSVLYEELMQNIENGVLNVKAKIDEIFENENISRNNYDLIIMILTMSDMFGPEDALSQYEAASYYFCLQVNIISAENRAGKRIPSPYLAIKTARSYNWDYASYIDSEESIGNNISNSQYFEFCFKFSYILNEFTFQVPVVQVKKGFLIKRNVGYMIDPNPNAYCIFTIGNDNERHKMPKSYLLKLLEDNMKNTKKFIMNDVADIIINVDRHNSAEYILELLYINGFFGICTYNNKDDSKFWVDDEDDNFYVESLDMPYFKEDKDEDEVFSAFKWQKIREHLFRAIHYNRKPYISYIYSNNVVFLSN